MFRNVKISWFHGGIKKVRLARLKVLIIKSENKGELTGQLLPGADLA